MTWAFFSTLDMHEGESIAHRHLTRAGITDLFIAGIDIDGENILATLDEVFAIGIRVHVVVDAFLNLYKIEDLWDVVRELQCQLVSTSEIMSGAIIPLTRPPFPDFRSNVFEKLHTYVSQHDALSEGFFQLVRDENAINELTKPHPMSGKSFVHYICELKSITAVKVLKEGLDHNVFDISHPAEVDCSTPTMVACRSGAYGCLEIILNCAAQSIGLELDVSDAYGRTAIMYTVMRRDVEIAALLMNHTMGGKTLLRAQDMCRRSILLLACQHAEHEPSFGLKSHQTKGEAVLEYLWEKFQSREFSENKCDAAGWSFWNYAVKHNLVKVMRRGLQFLSKGPDKDDAEPASTALGGRRGSIPLALRQANDKSNPQPSSSTFPNLPGDLKVAFSKTNFSSKRTKTTNNIKGQGTRQLGLRAVLLRTISFGMNLLHQATWQRREQVIGLLLGLYTKESLLQVTNEAGMSCLDLTVDDVDPRWPFILIKHGCCPKQTIGITMYHLCIKALLIGEPEVLKNMILSDDFGVSVDNHLVDLAARARFISTCTSTFTSSTAPLSQLGFSCSECELTRPGVTFCGVCAFLCHAGHKGVHHTVVEAFHCTCNTVTTCLCRKGSRTFEMPLEVIKSQPFATVDSLIAAVHLTNKGSPRKSLRRMSLGFKNLGTLEVGTPALFVPLKSARLGRMKTLKRQTTNASETSLTELTPEQQAEAELVRLQAEMTYRDFIRHVFLMFAAKRGNHVLIEELVKYIKPDSPVDDSLNRPLHLAARVGNLATCLLLKHNGARVSVTNTNGETPLHIAAQHGHVDVCQLIAHNSNLLKLDKMALTPLHHAIRNDKPDVVNFIAQSLRHRAKVSLPLDDMFFQATTKSRPGDKNACDATVVAKNLFGLPPGECEGHASPLHLAVRYGKVTCASVLMRHGASPLRIDATGFSPYQTALWELYATRKRLEAHQEFIKRQIGNASNESGLLSLSTGKNFFRNLPETQLAHIESQLEDLNKDLPPHLQTLSPRVAYDLVDEMGNAPEVQKTRVRFAYEYFMRWVVGYLAILLLLMVFSLPRTNERYYITRQVIASTQASGWESIASSNDTWTWMSINLASVASLIPPVIETMPVLGLDLFGAVRIRQVRDKVRTCPGTSYISNSGHEACMHTLMNPSIEDKANMPWTVPPWANLALLEPARHWREGSGPMRSLDYGQYSANGYFVDLDLTAMPSSQLATTIAALQTPDANGNTWFDLHTRFINIEYVIYNMNFDAFCTVSLMLEAGAAGELVPTLEVLTHTLMRHGADVYPSVGFKLATLLILLFMVSGIVSLVIRTSWRQAMRKSSTLFDIGISILALVLFVMDMVVTTQVQHMKLDISDTASFQGITDVNQLIEQQTYVIAVTIVLMWLRLIKYTVLLPSFGRVTYAFMNTMKNFEVLSYMLFVFFVIIGFLCTFRLAFGQILRTSTYDSTLNLLMQMMMGDWASEVFAELPIIIRTITNISFLVTVAVIFLNLFISVLSEVYPREKRRAALQCNDKLTVLIERDFIVKTHSMTQSDPSSTLILGTLRSQLIVPTLRSVSVVMRLFNVSWNLDVPETEFGWEKGREFHGVGLVVEDDRDDAPQPQRTGSVVD
eukprot:c9258_g1_i1.p1 GENE.c9258_g1_i1~~c9258_g1_i1.p1  ORF type:complete len:1607 (+),score=445.52 c9258_g1_i1:549-5369(+)